jgi:SAM-dependent methyltransferase
MYLLAREPEIGKRLPGPLVVAGMFVVTGSLLLPGLGSLRVAGSALIIVGASVLLRWTDAAALAWLAPMAIALGGVAHLGRYVLCLAAMLAVPLFLASGSSTLLLTERTFFGVHRVFADPDGSSAWHQLWHGRTLHGKQYQQAPWSQMPTTYYHRSGPVGDVFGALHTTGSSRPGGSGLAAAFVGLGSGTLAAYGREGDRFTFYEIDPAVLAIARDSGLFSFIKDSPAELKFVLGDARITLRQAAAGGYDVLLLDAFSSDAIPVHLITREAVKTYVRALAPRGILLVHISNHYVDLEPVVAALADDLGLAVRIRSDHERDASEEDTRTGHYASTWMALAQTSDALGLLSDSGRWTDPERRPGLRVWTDDYADLPSVFKWRNAFWFK